jgi:plasmid stabilization system protein ParE
VNVRYSETALADLDAILAYLNERSPSGGRRVMQSIQRAIELIGEYPDRGRLAGEGNVRVVPVGRYPYLIYWDVDESGPYIAHIRHAARRAWQGELEQ